MRHQKCKKGIMQQIQRTPFKTVYQCDYCGKILTVYQKRTATGSNPLRREKNA